MCLIWCNKKGYDTLLLYETISFNKVTRRVSNQFIKRCPLYFPSWFPSHHNPGTARWRKGTPSPSPSSPGRGGQSPSPTLCFLPAAALHLPFPPSSQTSQLLPKDIFPHCQTFHMLVRLRNYSLSPGDFWFSALKFAKQGFFLIYFPFKQFNKEIIFSLLPFFPSLALALWYSVYESIHSALRTF